MALHLRLATVQDGPLLWSWRNDPQVRANSFSQDEVAWNVHLDWLSRTLNSDHSRVWILEQDGVPVGQIRYDRCGDELEIDYSIDPAHRGRGLGTLLLQLSGPMACQELTATRIVGITFCGNTASERSFEQAGFVRAGMFWRGGHGCVRYERSCTAETTRCAS